MRSVATALLAAAAGATTSFAADVSDEAPVARITIETVSEYKVAYALGASRSVGIDRFVSAAIRQNEALPAVPADTIKTAASGSDLLGSTFEAGAPETQLGAFAPVPTARPSNPSSRTTVALREPASAGERRERDTDARERVVTLPVPLTLGAFR